MILAFDLGTGGAKVCVYTDEGVLHSKTFQPYETLYPEDGFHVQDPDNWWEAVRNGTRQLAAEDSSLSRNIHSIAISGQSLAVVPLDKNGDVLFHDVPIWSDTRSCAQTGSFFKTVDRDEWYHATGNGFSPECYSIFKIMWYRDNQPEQYAKIKTILGSKDYINYILTGNIATDFSYASGLGAYNLDKREYIDEYLDKSGIDPSLLPRPVESHELIGNLRQKAAEDLGLSADTRVYCGGVDNSCMALGAGNMKEGSAYLSLGSSAWIAVSSSHPLTDPGIKPFVFDHIVPGLYTSATSIFSAGSSLKWFRQNMAFGLETRAEQEGRDIYDLITEAAASSPPGADGVLFNPTLGGAPAASSYSNITGAFLNIRLGSSFNDLCRAVLEGITFELSAMWGKLNELCDLSDEIVIVGGGSRSAFWRQMFADVFVCNFSRISTDQDAAALGAASLAAVGSGVWSDFSEIKNVIKKLETVVPNPALTAGYEVQFARYSSTWKMLSEIGNSLDNYGGNG